MSIQEPRDFFHPYEYPQAAVYAIDQHKMHWMHDEAIMVSDVQDWKVNLTDRERHIVGSVLKGFTQTEVHVGDYWATQVPNWFPKPEIKLMARSFAGMEAMHAVAYSHLNTTLGLEDFEAFMSDPTTMAKLNALVDDSRSPALSLAVYSAFAEGVSLFSSFAILMSFSEQNKLKGVGQIVAWSVRDENLHSKAGCWLFRQYMHEHPELWNDELKGKLLDAARLTVKLENDFIDACFEHGDLDNLSCAQVKNLIAHRANMKLRELGFDKGEFEVDRAMLKELAWFDLATNGGELQDFFANIPTTYSKGHVDWSDAF